MGRYCSLSFTIRRSTARSRESATTLNLRIRKRTAPPLHQQSSWVAQLDVQPCSTPSDTISGSLPKVNNAKTDLGALGSTTTSFPRLVASVKVVGIVRSGVGRIDHEIVVVSLAHCSFPRVSSAYAATRRDGLTTALRCGNKGRLDLLNKETRSISVEAASTLRSALPRRRPSRERSPKSSAR